MLLLSIIVSFFLQRKLQNHQIYNEKKYDSFTAYYKRHWKHFLDIDSYKESIYYFVTNDKKKVY